MSKIFIKDIATGTKKLSSLINKYEAGKIETEKFRSLVYGISKLLEFYYKQDVEMKLSELEEKINREEVTTWT